LLRKSANSFGRNILLPKEIVLLQVKKLKVILYLYGNKISLLKKAEDLHTTGTNTGVTNPSSTEAQQPTSGSQKKPPRKSSTPRSGSAATGTANGGNTPRSRQTPSSRKRSNKKVAQDTNNATTGIIKDATPPIPS